ncbi:MAG: hypothetical protein LAT51_08585, partial [Flavobacteriaceae bacterium]|nr:hypothetical protein [Flavobacteriaceae bacterium]
FIVEAFDSNASTIKTNASAIKLIAFTIITQNPSTEELEFKILPDQLSRAGKNSSSYITKTNNKPQR